VGNLEVIEDSPLGQALLIFLEDKEYWKATPQELLDELKIVAEREKIDMESKLWPGHATWVTRRINEIRTLLIIEGINYKLEKEKRKRFLIFSKEQ